MAAAGFKRGDPGIKLARKSKSILGRLLSKHFIRLFAFAACTDETRHSLENRSRVASENTVYTPEIGPPPDYPL